jgi:hypothetical protein
LLFAPGAVLKVARRDHPGIARNAHDADEARQKFEWF